MKIGQRHDLRISVDDEAHLRRVATYRLTPLRLVLWALALVVVSAALGVLVVYATPLKTLLPGYMPRSQRSATEESLLRLDSLQAAYVQNEAYLNNINSILNTGRIPTDSVEVSRQAASLPYDSLLDASPRETEFVRSMQDREKYNISILAPLAAESIVFYPLSREGVVTRASRGSTHAVVAMPRGAEIDAIADATVIDAYARPGGGYTLTLQHARGFSSRVSGAGLPLVSSGEKVYGGQALAAGPASGNVILELWHNGEALVPYSQIGALQTGADQQNIK